MTLGPLEYTVIGFEGNRFNGEIAKDLAEVIDSGIIALVDLVFVTKDIDGNAKSLELDNKDDPRFAGFTGDARRPDRSAHRGGHRQRRGRPGAEHLRPRDHVRAPLGREAQGGDGHAPAGSSWRARRSGPRPLRCSNAELESAELTA